MKFASLARVVVAYILIAAAPELAASQYDQRVANLSTRGQVGTGDNIMITGFVVSDGAPKKVLLRAVGPSLANYGISSGRLNNPVLALYDGRGVLLNSNDNWSGDDAATMTSVGAFPLTTGSQDSVLVATLSPGNYTVQVTGSGSTSGIALLEVYDVSGSARLTNISTRAIVGSGTSTLIAGLSLAPSGGMRRLLVRAVGPGLSALGIAGANANPSFAIVDSANRQVAGGANDDWDGSAQMSAYFAQAGAFALTPGSKDAAVVVDLAPGTGTSSANYSILVSGVGGSTGVALVEVYDLTPETLSTVNVAATTASTDTQGGSPGVYTFTRTGPTTKAITVRYSLAGTAVAGTDYVPLFGSVNFPVGVSSVTVSLTALSNALNINNRTATLTLTPDNSYGIGVNDNASVTIFYNPGTLYLSNLRAPSGATSSTAYGTSTIQLSPDEKTAYVNVNFSNLSSPEVVAHLEIDGNYVYNLPQGQVTQAYWNFAPIGTYSTADLIAALKAGRISISIDTASYPTGELEGGFVRSSGSAAFNAPAAPPAIDLSKITDQDAARFLIQSTFGATTAEVAAVKQKGYNTWINEQIGLPATLHYNAAIDDMNTFGGGVAQTIVGQPANRISVTNRQNSWWKIAVTAPDQLRQRVAFALSEILVISDQNTTIGTWEDGATNYYDTLVTGAFGNYRTLLDQVTRSPMMGIYLSSLRNGKATYDSKGVQLTSADENYAREVMQLFTIGLNELNPDGTLRLDPSGQPIATYNQQTIGEMAKVFTGWSYNATVANPNFRSGAADYINPMILYPAFHDDTVKTIVGGKVIPASQGGAKDLKDALDTLFNHPNCGVFVSRELIQRLVTSNPSPGYIYRVAQVFANNGAGVRGDLGAVVRAILTDYEARSTALLSTPGHGKQKESMLRATAIFRAYNATSNSGRFNDPYTQQVSTNTDIGQAALHAPTVFNFFEPNYVLPGVLASAGLYAPEFQTLTDTTAISIPNYLYGFIYRTRSTTNTAEQLVGLSLDSISATIRTAPQPVLDSMNLLLCGGTMPKAMNDRILSALTSMPTSTADLERARSALYLVATSPESAIQK